MAFAVSSIANTVYGNHRTIHINVTPDSAEGTVLVPGMGSIVSHQWSKIGGTASMTCMTVKENLGTTATVIAGALGISNAVNGGIYRFTVFGSA